MLAGLFWINGRNSRTKWWLVQVPYLLFILYVVYGIVPQGGFVIDSQAAALAAQQREDFMMAQLQMLSSAMFVLVPLIWWTMVVNNIRRYHDRNKSGWWALAMFIPLAGPLWQLVELGFMPGTPGDNDYGPASGGAAFDEGGPDGSLRRGSLAAKVDDDYLAAYAKRYAEEQAKAAAPLEPRAPTPLNPASPTGGSFGKRR